MKRNPRLSGLSMGLATLLVLGLGVSQSSAANWVAYSQRKGGSVTWYYDSDSVRIEKNLRYVWSKTTYAKPEYVDVAKGYVSNQVAYVVVNCSTRTIAAKEAIWRDVNERILRSSSPDNLQFSAITPGSNAEILLNRVCSLGVRIEEAPRADGVLPPPAPNWAFVLTYGNQTWYYDVNSVRIDKNLRHVWTKMVFEKPQYEDFAKGYVSSHLFSWVADCSTRTLAIKGSVSRDVNERIIARFSSDNLEFGAMPGGSAGEHTINIVCSPGTRR